VCYNLIVLENIVGGAILKAVFEELDKNDWFLTTVYKKT